MVKPTPLFLAMLVTCPVTLAGQWQYEELKDEMTDRVSWRISTFATPFWDPIVMLNWWCKSDGLEVFLRAEEYLRGDAVQVQYRFDSDPASTPQSWEVSEPLVIAPKDAVQAITARARTAAKMLVRITAADGETFTYTFDVDGSIAAATDARLRASLSDKRGRMRSSDSLQYRLLRSRESLTFAAGYDRLPCKK